MTLQYLIRVDDKLNQDYFHMYIEKDQNQMILKNNYRHLILLYNPNDGEIQYTIKMVYIRFVSNWSDSLFVPL